MPTTVSFWAPTTLRCLFCINLASALGLFPGISKEREQSKLVDGPSPGQETQPCCRVHGNKKGSSPWHRAKSYCWIRRISHYKASLLRLLSLQTPDCSETCGLPRRPTGLRREWAHDSTFSCLLSKAQFRLSSGSLLAGPLVELSIIPSSSNLGGGHPLPSSSAQ